MDKDFFFWILIFLIIGQVKPTDPPTGGCVNTDNRCDGWASQGYCDSTNKEYLAIMKRKCCKACGGLLT